MNKRKTNTIPPANDPAHLVYLIKDEEHRIETRVRGVGAQRSDLAQRRYLKRVAKNRINRKRGKRPKGYRPIPKPKKHKWAKRPFQAKVSRHN